MIYPFEKETYKIIGAAQEVHRELGPGFLEIIYQDALEIEFKARGIPYLREPELPVYYKNEKLKRYFNADFLCYEKIIIETKATKRLTDEFFTKTLHYLKTS